MKMQNYPFPDPDLRGEVEDEDYAMEDWWLGKVDECWSKFQHCYGLIAHLEVPMHLLYKFMGYLGDFYFVSKLGDLHQELRNFLNFLLLVDREEEAREMLPYVRPLVSAAWFALEDQGHRIE
ncbi:uncharacterized protein LOC114841520 [Diachasma alloeum]|uniref:uncharacterized protein LOC114841520 n=1 Tax=Diachasma alloeum TaxID=454923 RepID=UPI0010FAF3E2|nr:uncharacterized protein LOC114841520 [Diachasma alloeum]